MLTASGHLLTYGISVQVARDFIINNFEANLSLVFETCKKYAVSNDMISDILVNDFPGLTAKVVSSYFDSNGFNSSQLDLSNINLGLGVLSNSSTFGVSALDSGFHWDLADSKEITYSFNTEEFGYPSDYNSYVDKSLTNGWAELNDKQTNAVRSIFDKLEDFLNVSFTEVSDSYAQSDGDIQINIVNLNQGTSGFAFYPGNYLSYNGDIFLSSAFNSSSKDYSLDIGKSGWNAIVHELGHALGLDHSFEGKDSTTLPIFLDDTNHTVMSYTNENNLVAEFVLASDKSISGNFPYVYSELYALYDIAALQSIYGANTTANIEDNVYTYTYSDYKISTIWDAGGNDVIDLSLTKGSSSIDLNPGSLNSVDKYTIDEIISLHQSSIDYSYHNDWIANTINLYETNYGLYTGKNNLGIATGTIIENVITGSGNDTVIDNVVNNIIQTNAGNDSIYLGNGGFDYVNGGSGYDTIFFNLNKSSISISDELEDGSYNLLHNDFGVNIIGIENIEFNDTSLLV